MVDFVSLLFLVNLNAFAFYPIMNFIMSRVGNLIVVRKANSALILFFPARSPSSTI
jgi:hypothetical protein